MGFLARLASGAIGQLFKGLFDAILQGIQQQQTRADQVALGQQQVMTTYAVQALQVQQRMQAEAVKPHDVAAATGALNAGTF